jgi:hypothetical protein
MEHTDPAVVRERADSNPSDVGAQIDAAYECDRSGLETEAAVYYDRVWRLGVPDRERHDFLIGYGSTLRNVGRLEESEEVLRIATGEHGDDLAARSFLALTLHSADRSDEAISVLLDCVVAGDGPGVRRFAPALSSYAEELGKG